MIYTDGVKITRRMDKEFLQIEPWGKNGLRVRATQNRGFIEDELGALLPGSEGGQPYANVSVTTNRVAGTAEIVNGKIRCTISCKGKLRFYNEKNELLLEECYRDRYGRKDPADPDSALELLPRTFLPHRGTDNYNLIERFEAKEDEKFFGMGQYEIQYVNLKGCSLELCQRNSQITIPFTISSRGYGFLWNNPAIGRASFNRNMTEWTADSTKQMDFWITAGDTPAEIEEAYADVTGKVPMMPEYATGLWQCKLRYRTQEEVLQVAREYKERGIPLSVIVIDFFHWTAQGDWKFDPELWPDPAAMVKELKEMGTELMVSIWPTVEKGSENFEELQELGYLIRTDAGPRLGIKNQDTYYDATNPDARKYVWSKIKQNYYDYGIKLYWLDECEPEITRYPNENIRFYLGSQKEIGNLYPRENSRMLYEGRKAEGETEIMSLSRCAWAGSQRYGALVWTGDISSDFPTLKNQIANALNMSLSGMPWWTTDIGGFHGGNGEDPMFRECLVRWFEFATFCPVLRMHGFREPKVISAPGKKFVMGDASTWKYTSGSPNELWSYGKDIYEILCYYADLREKMRPYVHGLMAEAHEKGTPIMRPLFYDFSEDAKAWEIEDEYMFGPDYLVAPITEMDCRKRSVYFPKGTWKNIHTGEVVVSKGGCTCEVDAALKFMPVYKIV